MTHPIGFSDSTNIIIKDNVPYFYYNGSSYLERLKNGLSLDFVFYMEDSASNYSIEENKENQQEKSEEDKYKKINNYQIFEEEFDIDILPKERKTNRILPKKKTQRNIKKNKVRQNGYKDKIFDSNQHSSLLDDGTLGLCKNYYSDLYYKSLKCYFCSHVIYDELKYMNINNIGLYPYYICTSCCQDYTTNCAKCGWRTYKESTYYNASCSKCSTFKCACGYCNICNTNDNPYYWSSDDEYYDDHFDP